MTSIRTRVIDLLADPRLAEAREGVRRLGRYATGVETRLQRRRHPEGYRKGLVSIVVPMYGVERYIDQCLESLSTQKHLGIEVIAVDDRSPDHSYEKARLWALRDPRIRVVRRATNGGLSAARNTGVLHARGEFLAFLDSDDFVERHTYSDAVASLTQTGSDLAVLPYRREYKGSFKQPAGWVRRAHSMVRKAVTLDEFPLIMVNATAWSKVYRRRFWDSCGFAFPTGVVYEDQALSMEAYARATTFDVLSRPSVNWRIREDRSSITQQLTSARNIRDHLVATRDSLDALERHASAAVRRERLKQMLNNNLNEFLQNMRSMDEEAWEALCEFVDYLADQAPTPEFWERIEARKKILLGLIQQREHTLALDFLAAQGWHRDHFPGHASAERDEVVGSFPLQDRLSTMLGPDAFTLCAEELQAAAIARRLTPTADGARLSVIAYINRLLPGEITDLRFELTCKAPGRKATTQELRWEKPGRLEEIPAEDVVGHTRRYADMREAIVDLLLPKAAFAADGDYTITATLASGAVTRRCSLDQEGRTESLPAVELGDGRVLRPFLGADHAGWQATGTHPLVFKAARPAVTLESLTIDGEAAQVRLTGRDLRTVLLVRDGDRRMLRRAISPLHAAEPALEPVQVTAGGPGSPAPAEGRAARMPATEAASATVAPAAATTLPSWSGRVQLPHRHIAGQVTVLRVLATDSTGATHDVYVPEGLTMALGEDGSARFAGQRRPARHARRLPKIHATTLLGRAPAKRAKGVPPTAGTVPAGAHPQPALVGGFSLADRKGCFVITDARVDRRALILEGVSAEGTPQIDRLEFTVRSTVFTLPLPSTSRVVERPDDTGAAPASATADTGALGGATGGALTLRIPLRGASFGLPARALPSGEATLRLLTASGTEVPVTVTTRLALRLPETTDLDDMRVRLTRLRDTSLGVTLSAPLAGDEVGMGNHWRLRDWSYKAPSAIRPAVLFRNLYGEAANDTALAVHEELRRRGTDLDLIWAVQDHSVVVPEGARVVLEESRAYYEAFGTASHIMVNVHQPDWFVKKPGQVVIETFHGYPFKLNGYRWWLRLDWTAERRESLLARADDWDYLVSPAAYATPILREFFRPGGGGQTRILEIGYPRNDALLAPGAPARREGARRRLGIRPGQKAVLYAPTFRDYVSADDTRAEMIDFVDLGRLARRLGDDYVILLRGHPFNARSGTQAEGRVVNVTDYPDINDLILASDLAVLDYSSLRFDYALTGKPAIFFVPDRERYFRGREGFLPYDETTPGPQIPAAADLERAILDAPRLAAEHEEARRAFLSRFMELEDGHATQRLIDRVFGSVRGRDC